jgi:hypothetical protein
VRGYCLVSVAFMLGSLTLKFVKLVMQGGGEVSAGLVCVP